MPKNYIEQNPLPDLGTKAKCSSYFLRDGLTIKKQAWLNFRNCFRHHTRLWRWTPIKLTAVPAFLIDATEVTNAQFQLNKRVMSPMQRSKAAQLWARSSSWRITVVEVWKRCQHPWGLNNPKHPAPHEPVWHGMMPTLMQTGWVMTYRWVGICSQRFSAKFRYWP